MQVVLLGTGTPTPDPDRWGPATAIVVNGAAYLVDFGAGVVRRAKAAVLEKGMTALEHGNMRVAFVTHLHSDHTVGYPDLILSPPYRKVPLEVYGPKGIKTMTEHVIAAWQADIDLRNRTEKLQNYSVNVHEVGPGVIYKDANVTVTAFATKHAYPETYGYRFETADRSIVIPGDTSPTQATIDACRGCDVLLHEAMSPEWLARANKMFGWDIQSYAAKYHTTTVQLAELATKAKPRLLVIYHASSSAIDGLLKEIQPRYSGQVVVGRDLDVY